MKMCVNELELCQIESLLKKFYARGDSVDLDRYWDHSQQRYMNVVTIRTIEVK